MTDPGQQRRRELRASMVGFGAALVLSVAAFAIVRWKLTTPGTTLAIVLILALIQIVVHFRYFLKISLNRSSRDDLVLILFSVLIIVLMVSGTLVLLLNLRARMM